MFWGNWAESEQNLQRRDLKTAYPVAWVVLSNAGMLLEQNTLGQKRENARIKRGCLKQKAIFQTLADSICDWDATAENKVLLQFRKYINQYGNKQLKESEITTWIAKEKSFR